MTLADATLTVDPTLQLEVALVDASGDNRIRLGELGSALINPTALAGMVDLDAPAARAMTSFSTRRRAWPRSFPARLHPSSLPGPGSHLTWADIENPHGCL